MNGTGFAVPALSKKKPTNCNRQYRLSGSYLRRNRSTPARRPAPPHERAGGVLGIDNAERNGRHLGTRTPDLYRPNFVVQTPKPPCFAAFCNRESAPQQPSFGDKLGTSFYTCWKAGPA